MKRIFACMLSMALLLSGCGGGADPDGGKLPDASQSPPGQSVESTTSNAALDVPLRYYAAGEVQSDDGTVIEIPQIVGEDNQAVQTINAELKDRFEQLKDTYADTGDDYWWCEALAWPTETDRYLNAVVTFVECPIYGTYGQVSSWVYDKQTGEQVLLSDALGAAGIDEEQLLQDFADWSVEQEREMAVTGLDSLAFRMLPDGQPQFLAGVTLEAADLGEYWISYHTWTDGEIAWTSADPFDPAEVTGEYPDGLLVCQSRWAEENDNVSLSWVSESGGIWPLTYTFETLQFTGHGDTELDSANQELLTMVDNERQLYDACAALSEAERTDRGASWGDIWAYPVVSGRYLNAIVVKRENMHYRVDGENTWNLVSSVVYDTEENRIISIDEALYTAWADPGDLENDVYNFVVENQMGTYENLSSMDFFMLEDGTPVFMIGAVVFENGASMSWPTFFTWTDGIVEWTDEHPVPLYLVDMSQDGLACQQGMGQYDGAAIISEGEAFATLSEIAQVQEYLSLGMTMVNHGTTQYIDGEEHLCIAVGTDHGDQFVSEFLYAVSWYSVYCMDPVNGDWVSVGFG